MTGLVVGEDLWESSVVVFVVSDSNLWREHSDLAWWDLSLLEIIIVLKWHVSLVPVIVWGTMCLFEACEFLTHLHLTLKYSTEIPSGKYTVVRNNVIHGTWFIIMVVLEAGSIWVPKDEWHEGVTIIDSIQLFTFHELLNVVLNDWGLMDNSSLCSSCVNTDAITKSKDVLESLVLKSVWVYIDNSFFVSNSWIKKLLMWFAWWVNYSWEEIFLDGLSSIYASECSNLLTVFVLLNRHHFPSKVNINSSLSAFFKCNFIGIWEFEDFFVWSPELDLSIFCWSTL